MDPQTFVRLSVGQLGLRLPGASARKACHCEIRLRGFPVQTAPVPLINSSVFNLDPHGNAAVFSLDEHGLKALSTPGCFRAPEPPYVEIAVYVGRRGGGGYFAGMTRRLIGAVRVDIGQEWRDGKPLLLHHGWRGVGKGQLHVKVKVEADPRYVFQFEDEVALNPQVVQLHGRARQPIFNCKFIRDVRRASQPDHLGGQYWSSSGGGEEKEMVGMVGTRRERKGWKGGDSRPVRLRRGRCVHGHAVRAGDWVRHGGAVKPRGVAHCALRHDGTVVGELAAVGPAGGVAGVRVGGQGEGHRVPAAAPPPRAA